jgi:hypothetical protein
MWRTSHEDTRHIFVAPRNNDHTVEPMSAGSRLDLIGNEIPRLERIGHPTRSHADAITDAYCSELVANDAHIRERNFSTLT